MVGIFPDDTSLLRLTTMSVIEQNDEWLVSRRYLSAHSYTRSWDLTMPDPTYLFPAAL